MPQPDAYQDFNRSLRDLGGDSQSLEEGCLLGSQTRVLCGKDDIKGCQRSSLGWGSHLCTEIFVIKPHVCHMSTRQNFCHMSTNHNLVTCHQDTTLSHVNKPKLSHINNHIHGVVLCIICPCSITTLQEKGTMFYHSSDNQHHKGHQNHHRKLSEL